MFFNRHRQLTEQQRESHIRDRRVHLANERTFLAWIRTAVSIIGFGIFVDKFVIFFHYITEDHAAVCGRFSTISNIVGIILVILGCLTGMLAAYRYIKTEKDIEKGQFKPSVVIDMLFIFIFLILVAFLVMYLLNARLITNP